MEIFFLLIWIIPSILIGLGASEKGRSGIGFFLLSIFLSPLLGLIIVAIISTDYKELKRREEKKCPLCKEIIKIDAVKCKHCGNILSNSKDSKEKSIEKYWNYW